MLWAGAAVPGVPGVGALRGEAAEEQDGHPSIQQELPWSQHKDKEGRRLVCGELENPDVDVTVLFPSSQQSCTESLQGCVSQ